MYCSPFSLYSFLVTCTTRTRPPRCSGSLGFTGFGLCPSFSCFCSFCWFLLLLLVLLLSAACDGSGSILFRFLRFTPSAGVSRCAHLLSSPEFLVYWLGLLGIFSSFCSICSFCLLC